MNNIGWITAPFLWIEALNDKNNLRFKQPAILRFDSDNFMEDMLKQIDQDPSLLKDYVARYETWTDKNAGWLQESELLSQVKTLKLYQPAHGFFYLVAASLVCQIPGFPDRKVDASNEEKVSYVIRRLLPGKKDTSVNPKDPATYIEYARVGQGWMQAPPAGAFDEEQRQPLFELNFKEKGRRRRLLAGVIPVANREKYEAEPKFSPPAKPSQGTEDELAKDPRRALFETRVIDAMKDLRKTIIEGKINDTNAQDVFIHILLDMADFLMRYTGEAWNSVISGTWQGSNDDKKNLFIALTKDFSERKKLKWFDILKKDESGISLIIKDLNLGEIKDSIYALNDLDNFKNIVQLALDPQIDSRLAQFETYIAEPLSKLLLKITRMSDEQARQVFLFIILDFAQFISEHLGDVWEDIKNNAWTGRDGSKKKLFDTLENAGFYGIYRWDNALREIWDKKDNVISGETIGSLITGLKRDSIIGAINSLGIMGYEYQKSSIYDCIRNAIISSTPAQKPQEIADPGSGAIYFIRCIYDRPKCKHIPSPVVSEPSQAFQLAPFYDPDAPSRPVRISLPIDTSISGLRKYPRNVSFLISDTLKQQMERIKGKKLTELDEGKVEPEGKLGLGMICSFSIPIITICALILLMIIVQLLNIVFWWLPFFRICLPLNLKAK